MPDIRIRGARTHNLKGIDVDIPRDKLVVITGLSGSGKSSLAFDTLYAEGQRRYVESLSSYARQFLGVRNKPDVDLIEGLSPAISIEQKTSSHNPRSTVGTVTEILDYLRLLYARIGEAKCPDHGESLQGKSPAAITGEIQQRWDQRRVMLLAPAVRGQRGEHRALIHDLKMRGFVRIRVNGIVTDLDEIDALPKEKKHYVELIVDRLRVKDQDQSNLSESVELALKEGDGLMMVADMDSDETVVFSSRLSCPVCGFAMPKLEPRLFSFNSPQGACTSCDGLGELLAPDPELIVPDPTLSIREGAILGYTYGGWRYRTLISVSEHFDIDFHTPWKDLDPNTRDLLINGDPEKKARTYVYRTKKGRAYSNKRVWRGLVDAFATRYREVDSDRARLEVERAMSRRPCAACGGTRLNPGASNVFVADSGIATLCNFSIEELLEWCEQLSLSTKSATIAASILKEVEARSRFLAEVGLGYLSLSRRAQTLSGGEAQRIRLASQIGSGLLGVLYVLDEPSIGLHQSDNFLLLRTLKRLRDLGNTVVVVEHDEETIRAADYVIDIGPLAGVQGGEVVASGTPDLIEDAATLTGQYLSGERRVTEDTTARPVDGPNIVLNGARGNNLKNISVKIPLGTLTCVTGVSGSGKSTLVNGTLLPATKQAINRVTPHPPAAHDEITGLHHLDNVISIDQSPIGRTPRSNPATYTGVFDHIRTLFAGTREARSRGYKPGRFSFNVAGGRCAACSGDGTIKVEMHFLPDVYVSCDECQGKRYNEETLQIRYASLNIAEVLDLSITEAYQVFRDIPALATRLERLVDVGLGYLGLGQSATTLSGGEAQRIKLSRELAKRDTKNTLYFLDEPTTGLHFHDVHLLIKVLNKLVDRGNTVVVIEHNIDVIRGADWIVDLGPLGGKRGGEVIHNGCLPSLMKHKSSLTAQCLRGEEDIRKR